MGNWIRVAAGLALVLGAGLVHGEWTNRWRLAGELTETARRLESLPMTIGDWVGTSGQIPEDHLRIAGATGSLLRRYRNVRSGEEASVMILCGPPGNIVNHTPDVCYPGQGYALDAPRPFQLAAETAAGAAEFLTAIATRAGSAPSSLRIFWTWNDAKGWRAPNAPFWTFAAAPVLCKLYVVRETGGATVAPDDDPAGEFLAELIPAINRAVFPTADADAAAPPAE